LKQQQWSKNDLKQQQQIRTIVNSNKSFLLHCCCFKSFLFLWLLFPIVLIL
jgi:hypothetical protein